MRGGLGPKGCGLGKWVLSGTPQLLPACPPQHHPYVSPQVTHHQESLFDLQRLEVPGLTLEELQSLSRNMAFQLRRLVDERDSCREVSFQVALQLGDRWGGV